MFTRTTTVNKLLQMSGRIKVVQGGTSAGKTYGIIPVLIDQATRTPRIRITVVAETLPAVKDGALQIFKDVMIDTGRWIDDRFNRSSLHYTFANGAVIQFKSFDTVGKAKSAGKRDVLFLNEANHIPYEVADTLMIRSKETWIDFNPDNKFWVHTDTLQHPESEFLLLTYKDNEACPEETIRDLEYKKKLARTSDFWKNWCRVYIDGEIGKLQDTIFDNWQQIDDKPERFQEYVYALDFGFIHPTAFVRVWYHEDELFIEKLIYESGMTSKDIRSRLHELGVEYSADIVADPARPELITDIELEGFNILKANKSVQYGFDIVRSFKVYYDQKDDDIKNEYESYRHKKVREELTDDPIKKNDDLMDAIRYGAVFIYENYSRDNSYESF
jgi:phage terminase large subunit